MGLLTPFLRRRRIAVAAPHLRTPILDFGCGTGALAAKFHPNEYVGFDVNPKQLAVAKTSHPRHRFTDSLPSGQFSCIAALAVLEHVDDPLSTVRELASRLSDNGRIVATTPHPDFEWVHTVSAYVGLAKMEAHHEHQVLIDRPQLEAVGAKVGLVIEEYRRFLGPMNQLVVWRASSNTA